METQKIKLLSLHFKKNRVHVLAVMQLVVSLAMYLTLSLVGAPFWGAFGISMLYWFLV